jgi:exodeoxyribonuclease-3
MKIISYNVNGIRSALNKGLITWLMHEKPDVLCIQETKAQPDQIPLDELMALGYHCHWFSAQKKGYSGVGIISLQKPDKVVLGMGIDQYDDEGRIIRADFGELSVMSVYHPSGTTGELRQDFKMQWLEHFYDYAYDLLHERPKLVISGDFNICHKPIDIHDPVRNATVSGFLPQERAWMEDFLKGGFIDSFRYFNRHPHHYSWWSYLAGARARNLGWRIDYNMTSPALKNRQTAARMLPEVMHSDHCPVLLELD